MNPDNLVVLAKNFHYGYPLISFGLMAVLAVFAFVKPKAAAKTLAAALVFSLIYYCFSILGKASSAGVDNKDRMINQTVNKTR